MSKSDRGGRRGKSDASKQPGVDDGGEARGGSPARRGASDQRPLLARLLDTPHLAQVVPRLQPEVLHRVIQTCGLEDCSELVALATSDQLSRVFDLDLWRSARPGLEEQLDANRFGVWLEVLMESSPEAAAEKVVGLDVDLVIAALAQHVAVFDAAAAAPYTTSDGTEITPSRRTSIGTTVEVGGYLVDARRPESMDAIVELLLCLNAEHSEYFHRVMSGCRRLSDSDHEIDGLHNLLGDVEQGLFELASGREQRRGQRGYVSPAEAGAFLKMARQLPLGPDAAPPGNPLAKAYFQTLETTPPDAPEADADSNNLDLAGAESAESQQHREAMASVMDLLVKEGVLSDQPRGFLEAARDRTSDRPRLQELMEFARDSEPVAFSRRAEELAYLGNTLAAGCSLQGRPFTPAEASEAAAAVCNLGLENWPRHWRHDQPGRGFEPEDIASPLPPDFVVNQDLIVVFQVGWTVLYRDVLMYAAERLIVVLADLRCSDRVIQRNLDSLRFDLSRHWRDGMPWRAHDSLDVLASLDILAWTVLLGLISECPVEHAAIKALPGSGVRSVSASAFTFISGNRQIATVHAFVQSLADTLSN